MIHACHMPKQHEYVKLFPNMLAPRFPSWQCHLLSFHMFLLFLTSMMGVRRGDGRGGDGRDQAREQQEQERNCPHGDYWRRLHVRGRSNTDRFHPYSPTTAWTVCCFTLIPSVSELNKIVKDSVRLQRTAFVPMRTDQPVPTL